jgi:hypothetical protein
VGIVVGAAATMGVDTTESVAAGRAGLLGVGAGESHFSGCDSEYGDSVSNRSTYLFLPYPRHKSSTSRFGGSGGGSGFLLPRAKSHYAPDLRLVPTHLGKQGCIE